MANALLEAIDGRTQRTFAYPCGDTMVGDSSYVGEVKRLVSGARGGGGRLQTIDDIDLYDGGSFMINGHSGDDLIRLVNDAAVRNALAVFLFHGIGGEHSLNVSSADHRELITFLKHNENEIWVATMVDLCEYVRRVRGEK